MKHFINVTIYIFFQYLKQIRFYLILLLIVSLGLIFGYCNSHYDSANSQKHLISLPFKKNLLDLNKEFVFSSKKNNLNLFHIIGNGSFLIEHGNLIYETNPNTKKTILWLPVSFNSNELNILDISILLQGHLPNFTFLKNMIKKNKRLKKNKIRILWKTTYNANFPYYQSMEQFIKPGKWHSYRFIPAENPLWRDKITGIGIIISGPPAKIRINKIHLFKKLRNTNTCFPSRFRIGPETKPTIFLYNNRYSSRFNSRNHSNLEFDFSPIKFVKSREISFARLEVFLLSGQLMQQKIFNKRFKIPKQKIFPPWQHIKISLPKLNTSELTIFWKWYIEKSSNNNKVIPTFGALSQPFISSNAPSTQKNLILISLDTLRADHLGCYGYPITTSPFIDKLSRMGTTFSQGVTPYPSTAPAHISLMTGLFPFQHGVIKGNNRLNYFTKTIAEKFLEKGLITHAVTGGGNVSAFHRIDKGFLTYDDELRSVKTIKIKVIPWLEKNWNKPFFLFYHTYEIHAPFTKHKPLIDYFAPNYTGSVTGKEFINKFSDYNFSKNDVHYLKALYDAGIRFTDSYLKLLFFKLKKLKILNKTEIILVSDHGEHFSEHGLYGHGNSLYEPLIKVPLIFIGNNCCKSSQIIETPANLVDIAPTVLAQFFSDNSFKNPGKNLSKLLAGKIILNNRKTFSELRHRNKNWSGWIDQFAALDKNYKLILTLPNGIKNLYPLPSQERFKDDISTDNPSAVKNFTHALKKFLQKFKKETKEKSIEGDKPLDAKTKRLLKALGYLQ